jgi:hypothetical protein
MHRLEEGVLQQPEAREDHDLDDEDFDVGGLHEGPIPGVKVGRSYLNLPPDWSAAGPALAMGEGHEPNATARASK